MPVRTRVRLFSVAAAIAVGVLVVPACSSPGPCFGLGVGKKIGITIVDYYSGNPDYVQDNRSSTTPPGINSCAFGFDVTKGQELFATVESTSGASDSCQVPLLAFEPFGAWAWTDGRGFGGTSESVFGGTYTETSTYCQGPVYLSAVAAAVNQDIFEAPAMGQAPPVVMGRNFLGSGADSGIAPCSMGCRGDFVVALHRLN